MTNQSLDLIATKGMRGNCVVRSPGDLRSASRSQNETLAEFLAILGYFSSLIFLTAKKNLNLKLDEGKLFINFIYFEIIIFIYYAFIFYFLSR